MKIKQHLVADIISAKLRHLLDSHDSRKEIAELIYLRDQVEKGNTELTERLYNEFEEFFSTKVLFQDSEY